MIPASLHHRLFSVANQVAPRIEGEDAPAHLHLEAAYEKVELRDCVRAAPALCLVLEGRRTLQRAGRREIVCAGELALLPAGFRIDLRDEPGEESGRFRAVELTFSEPLLGRFLDRSHEPVERMPGASSLRLHPDAALAEALAGAIEALLAPERYGALLAERLLFDVLLRLRAQDRMPDLVGALVGDVESRVRELVRLNPAEAWTAERLAPHLGLTEAEVEAALADAGGLEFVVDDERMGRAIRLLQEGGVSLADVAYACGFGSPEFFAVRLHAHREEMRGLAANA